VSREDEALEGMEDGADRAEVAQFAVAVAVGDDKFDGFFVDIKADELIVTAHVLVSYIGVCVGGVCCRASLHHAALFAFCEQPAHRRTSTYFYQRPLHATIVFMRQLKRRHNE
jgi:hypothetical protein